MSDIAMRFGGIVTVAALALGAALYLLIAIVALLAGALIRHQRPRSTWRVAGAAGGLRGVTLALLLVIFTYRAANGTEYTGIDWFDLPTLPWIVVFAAGCRLLTRVHGA